MKRPKCVYYTSDECCKVVFSWQVITEVWPDLKSRGEVCGLLGLHTCGDLAPTLLRIYANMSACRGVVSVGCCYMKLSTSR